jgi:hypothetical protein
MKIGIDKRGMLDRLERIRYEKEKDRDADPLDQMSLSGALLILAEINHDREFLLCRSVAEHLLESVPEPDDADIEDE